MGPVPLTCDHARYDARSVPTKGLFQGNLADDKQAARLGITRSPVPTAGLQCDTGAFDFHFIDPNKAVTALDNVIYVLARQAPQTAGQPPSVKAACQPWLQPAGSSKRHLLDSVAVVNDPPTVKEPQAPATLHPDTETTKGNVLIQTWTLADYRDRPLYLRCKYEGTSITSVEPVPDDAAECRMSVGWNAKRRRVDAALAPLVLECR
ncbi:MAG: STY0301 family protein [Alphaproteobacteria bacterium]